LKNLKQNLFLSVKILIIFFIVGVFTVDVSAQQWGTSVPGNNPPYPPAENVKLPLTVGISPETKDGPLFINNLDIAVHFGLRIPYKGILLGAIDPALLQGALGLLHIHNVGTGPAIRVDGPSWTLVAESDQAKIGIGTLSPEYSIDITGTGMTQDTGIIIGTSPHTAAERNSLYIFNKRIKIMGGNPSPGAVLTLINNEGEAVWSAAPIGGYQPYNLFQYVEESWEDGVTSTGAAYGNNPQNNPFRNLRPGIWEITIYGTTGIIGTNNPHTVRVIINCPLSSTLGPRIDFDINNNPDGNAPFSVTQIVRLPLTGGSCVGFEAGVVEVGNDTTITPPRINGITALRLGSF